MDDPLNYVALGILCFVIITLFYGIIAIHDSPYYIAESRNHPHQDAIYAAVGGEQSSSLPRPANTDFCDIDMPCS